jgi:hypothetical protein
MGFEKPETEWLEAVIGERADFEKAEARMIARQEQLDAILGEVDALSEELRAANAALEITFEDRTRFWQRQKKRMEWMTGDRDEEVDTVHDLRGEYRVDEEKARRVLELHERLVALQTRMETATDADGEPLFEARDIERELWSPLIRADIIPSNAVADKYSQEAQVWNGACGIYAEKLEEYTLTASKYDQVQRMLRIAGDTVQMVGTVAAESIKAANFDALSVTREETQTFKEIKPGVEEKLGEESVSGLNRDQIRDLADEKGIDPDTLQSYADHKEKLAQAKVAKRDMAITMLGVAVAQGGLTIADKALEKRDKKYAFNIAEGVYDVVSDVAMKSLSVAESSIKVSDSGRAASTSHKTMMGQVKNLTQYGLKAGKIVFRAAEIAEADDPATQKKAAFQMVGSIAGAVGNAFAAFDRAGTPEEGGTGGQFTRLGAYVEAGILASANAAKIATEIAEARKAGRDPNWAAIGASLGLSAIGPVMAGTFDPLSDASRADAGSGEDAGVFEETPEEKAAREKKLAGAIQKMGGRQVDPSKVLELFQGSETDEARRRKELAERLETEEREAKEAGIGAFKASLRDPATKAEFLASIEKETGRELDALDALIDEATVDRDELAADEEKAARAMAAVEKLIAEAQKLNQTWDMVNALTSGGTAILVAALPVAGLAAAIQKLAMDTAILVRKSIQLNTWMDNMALTMGNSSVYGPAIAGRLASAKVQVSQQSARVVFDAIGVAAESAKLADSMGVATGLSIGNNMARALTEYGFKLHKEAEIERGWHLYKKARANPGDRKRARKAMKWNSTLSKCVLAYGIVMDGDPIAKEVGRSCGLTPEILADQHAVCGKVVTYFETLYTDDPVVLRRVPLRKDWHPGEPELTFDSWLRFRAAAANRAVPPIGEGSTATPLIDAHFARLDGLLGGSADYAAKRDDDYPEALEEEIEDEEAPGGSYRAPLRAGEDYGAWLGRVRDELTGLLGALGAYRPLAGPCPEDAEEPWIEGLHHGPMQEVVDSLMAQVAMMRAEVDYDIRQHEAMRETLERQQLFWALPGSDDELLAEEAV